MNAPNFIISGLGNPGSKYDGTRHNVGFLTVDRLAEEMGGSWQFQSKFGLEIAEVANGLLLKPLRFMNNSGQVLASYLQYYWKEQWQNERPKVLSSLYLVYDDLDIAFGEYKLQFGTGPKIHNGVTSVVTTLGSDQFWHLRIGVDSRQGNRQLAGSEYVLQQFSPEECQRLQSVLSVALSQLQTQLDKSVYSNK